MSASDPLLEYRNEFPSLRKVKHFISHSLGAMPQGAYDELGSFADKWVEKSIEAWWDWLPMVTECGDRIGRIIGAPEGTVVMHQNVSTWMGILASCLDYSKRNKVVLADMSFPSVGYVWKEQERLGAKVDFIPTDDGITVPTERFIKAIDETTSVVIIELVLYRSGAIQDAKAIVKAAHDKGALAIVDAYQAVGTVPVDVVDMDCDFFTGGSVKWLCGGPGAAYLYAKKELITKFEPYLAGWFSHKEPFKFVPGKIEYRDDIMRYMGGTPSVPALYSCKAGQEIVHKIGVGNIRKKSLRQTGRIMEAADEAGMTVNTPREDANRGGMVCVDFDGAEEASKELIKRNFMIDYRPRCGIRLSPHFYTKDDEIEEILAEMKSLQSAKKA